MAEHWIPASEALEIGGSAFAICSRLHAGLISARANLLKIGDKHHELIEIPKEFWWAEGNLALEQDWRTGDFSTWIEQKHHMQAYGVSIGLSGLLEMIPFERRPVVTRSLSVAGNTEWMTAREARQFAYEHCGANPSLAGSFILAQARLGFLAGRAVMAANRSSTSLHWEEREWDVPMWFWQNFTDSATSFQDWVTGSFRGRGRSPDGQREMTLGGLHFHRDGIAAMAIPQTLGEQPANKLTGRKREYDWEAAGNAVWGRINRGNLIPESQSDIEKAMQAALRKGDKEPSESTVRPYANRIWLEYQKD